MLLDDMTDVVGVIGNHCIEMLKMVFKLVQLTWGAGCSLRILWNWLVSYSLRASFSPL